MKLGCGKITFRNVERKRTPVRSPYACVTTTTYVWRREERGVNVMTSMVPQMLMCTYTHVCVYVCRWWGEERGCVQVVEGGGGCVQVVGGGEGGLVLGVLWR